MSPLLMNLSELEEKDRGRVGGKGFALALLARQKIAVPDTVCVLAEVYDEYLDRTGLRERILLELNRKDFKDMRWEEIWDASLRIRNLFLTHPLPPDVARPMADDLQARFGSRPVVARSSAPEEDSAGASFAGLHESYVNVRGTESILKHVRLVWASLWSDAALLYRQELGLEAARSSMAVVIQELVAGEKSGVLFTRSPSDPSCLAIEAVWGLNQGLVDGAVEPDRWIVHRESLEILSHRPAARDNQAAPAEDGARLEPLPEDRRSRPPLAADEVTEIARTALRWESVQGVPQDMEWTFRQGKPVFLQARPVTTSRGSSDDQRGWYLSLRRSFENLQALRKKIEEDHIPSMIREARELAGKDFASLSDEELAREIRERATVNERWVSVYWADFIPFAHGIRLFGQLYNDALQPEDPYEFMGLLEASPLESLERNRSLESLASMIRSDSSIASRIRQGRFTEAGPSFQAALDDFVARFGDLSCPVTGGVQCMQGQPALMTILLEMAEHPPRQRGASKDRRVLEDRFLQAFHEGRRREEAGQVLELARVSYRLRDDDNIHLGRIEAQTLAAVHEGRRRLKRRGLQRMEETTPEEVARALENPDYLPAASPISEIPAGVSSRPSATKARQLVGQPGGPGLARGRARVIADHARLKDFKHGEILVCDAVDPNMTFVAPLAAGVVERRGGMLIHGAIIAREYGLPCVTGVPRVTELVATGDEITVDGYLGIVTVERTVGGRR